VIIINEDNKYGIIYCAINIINNKKYIGQTIRNLDKRIKEHISHASKDNKYAFHLAINKYGIDKFEWEEIDIANNQEELDEKELYWIKFYNTYGKGGYNMSVGGQFNKKTDDNADKLSEMNGGREFLVFDLGGNFIKSAFSQTAFADEIGVSIASVNNVLIGIKGKISVKRKILIFKDEFTEEKLQSMIKRTYFKEFAVFDLKDEFIGIWNNQVFCSRDLKVSRTTIGKCLKINLIKQVVIIFTY
jgi:group I intron endonuclease